MHPLERLTEHLGGAAIWTNRRDCNSGLAYGGNKMRKLEYIAPDVVAQGADTLVSIGGYQSNHNRYVAALAARIGLKAVLVQEKWVDWPDSANDRVGNILLSRIMGAEVRLDPSGFGIGFKDDEITALEGWAGDLYGVPLRSTLDAIQLSGSPEGMIIIPVYEGKSMAALVDLVRTGDIGRDSTLLYAHLGGQPVLNAYRAPFTA